MKRGELRLYDVIGADPFDGGVSASAFADELQALDLGEGDEIVLRVNSPGGDVFDGLAIYNTLLQHPARKVVKVEGIAASAASFLIQAADEIQIAPASFLMVHRAWGMTIGNAEEHLSMAAQLEQADDVIADIYAKRSGRTRRKFLEMMSAGTDGTWLTGQQAVDERLADSLIETPKKKAPTEDAPADVSAAARRAALLAKFTIPENVKASIASQESARSVRAESGPPPEPAAASEPADGGPQVAELSRQVAQLRGEIDFLAARIETHDALAGL